MKRSRVVFAFVMMGLLAACGGDDSDTKDSGKKTGSQEKAGSGGSEQGGKACGSKTCTLPKGVTGEACCKDEFSSACGVKATPTSQCRDLPKVDERCPVPELMFRAPMGTGMTTAYGCCTSSGECGIDFGSGCQSRSFLCNVVGPDQAKDLKLQKCDGEEIPLPADCGMNMIRIPMPGAAGSGS